MAIQQVRPRTLKVCVGAPCGKQPICDKFYDCFGGLQLPPGSIWQRSIGGSVPNNLNKLVDAALDAKCTHLFIVEDDSVFNRDAVMRLLAHDKPVVAGLCRQRSAPFRSYVYKGLNENGLGWYELKPEDRGLIRCDATGMGGILINTDVFDKLTRPYFSYYYVGEKEWGQDIVFGKSLVEAGVEVFCDLDVHIGHVTQCVVGSERTADGWNVTLGVDEIKVGFPQPALVK